MRGGAKGKKPGQASESSKPNTASGSGLKAVKALKQPGGTSSPPDPTANETKTPEAEAIDAGQPLEVPQLRPNPALQLKNFDLQATLGTGTFGRVRLVHHLPDNKIYAMKILKKEAILRLDQINHIASEVDLLMRLEHPFLVNMHGIFQDGINVYMCLEFVPGGEVFSILRDLGRFPEDQGKFYTAEICLAFEYLHRFHVAYRDLKPENLLVSRTGHIKITDFGFAKIVQDKTWTLCGTPEYLAPEIIQSKGHGMGVDWWAFGVLMYEFLAGYPPFWDEHPFAIYQKILSNQIEYPRHFATPVKDLLGKLLQADITHRFGCLKNGAADIKHHAWFEGTDWDALLHMRVDNPPWIPPVSADDDVQNFDEVSILPPHAHTRVFSATARQAILLQQSTSSTP